MRKIGILGGTFNPIHTGHLLLAEWAMEALLLEEVWLIPTGISYRKSQTNVLPGDERLYMTRLAAGENDRLRCLDLEVRREGYTYTWETLEQLQAANPDVRFFFILGADCLFSIEHWKNPEKIFQCCALAAAVLNCIFGTILAWVLVRYEFPGKRLMDGMIELPFALPTAVAGITLTKMYSDTGAIGRAFEKLGIEIAYTRTGIIIAMVFIGIPFVVRAIQPVLEKLPATYEEAAGMLGASRLTIFWKVIFPEIRPALLTGFGLALARGIGEYGSVIYISGNSEKNGTQVVSYVIMQKLNSGNVDYEGAAAIALVLLILSFVMLFAINFIQHIASRRTNV